MKSMHKTCLREALEVVRAVRRGSEKRTHRQKVEDGMLGIAESYLVRVLLLQDTTPRGRRKGTNQP